jgi:hypothetical protein
MTAAIVRFPARRIAAVWIMQTSEGAWLVLARGHGWLHGSRSDALANANWLAGNLGFLVREAS